MAIAQDGASRWNFPIVGVGASAGGIQALRTLVASLPEKTGLSFIFVQHLSPDHPSMLVKLLGISSALQVQEAVDGISLEADHIYVSAPSQAVTVEEGLLRSRPLLGHACPGIDTVDTLFESLATDCGPKAIGVILSGTGSDGAAGVVRIKQAGGLVFVQDPITATHNGMPCAAIATGVVDHVAPVEVLADKLLAHASGSRSAIADDYSLDNDSKKAAEEILSIVYRCADFDMSGYKITPLLWRIQRRMHIRRVKKFSDYRDLLHDDRAEIESLIRGLPIHVTAFFRDTEAWTDLQHNVIEPLLAEHNSEQAVRVWTPACSTGEEAYSVAMLLAEASRNSEAHTDFQVFATDALPEIVARASRGQFSEAAVGMLDANRKDAFFYTVDGAYRVRRELREKLIFAPQRLLDDAPFSNLDLVTCRNLLIYLEPRAQQKVLTLLHASLRMGGYLFLGSSESLSPKQPGFEVISWQWNIYRKVGPIKNIKVNFPKHVKQGKNRKSFDELLAETTHQAIVERLDLPSVLIDENFTILRIYGDTDEILRLPPGQPTHNLLGVVQPLLAPYLKMAVATALNESRTVTSSHLHTSHKENALSLRVTPLHGGSPARLFVSFLGSAALRETSAAAQEALENEANFDAALASDALKISIEELDASKEELQALNEELRAVNEQLNISNEEINQVNAQLCGKVEELETQSNVLSSGHVMTLFVDEELRVRWFTPAIKELFPLRSTDTGRHITDLVQKFKDDSFMHDIHAVMTHGQLIEAEVSSEDDRWYLRQIRPFHTKAKSNSGVAITFNDITDRKRAQVALADELSAMVQLHELADRLLTISDVQTAMDDVVDAAIDFYGGNRGIIQLYDSNAEVLQYVGSRGFDPDELYGIKSIMHDFNSTCAVALRTGQRVNTSSDLDWTDHSSAAASLGYKAAISAPIKTHRDKLLGVLTVFFLKPYMPTDLELQWGDLFVRMAAHMIVRGHAEEALHASEKKYHTLFDSIDEGFCTFDMIFDDAGVPVDYRFVEYNLAFERHTGWKDVVGRTVREVLPDQDQQWFEIYGRVGMTGEPIRVTRYGEALKRWIEVYAFRIGEPEQRRVAALFSDWSWSCPILTDSFFMESRRSRLAKADCSLSRFDHSLSVSFQNCSVISILAQNACEWGCTRTRSR